MKGVLSAELILELTMGVVICMLLVTGAKLWILSHKKRTQVSLSRRASTIPISANGVDAFSVVSDSTMEQESPRHSDSEAGGPLWMKGTKRKKLPKYSFKYGDLKRATRNFETLIGQGAFGPVYKSQMPTGEIVAVKVLATNSKQGKKDFQTEVVLLGRLHHRNIVNLVGYCAEEGQHMLIYDYMTNGSLASQLYSEKHNVLSWDLRVNIALDVARGLEYLHDGVFPPVVHHDIKSSNILLDNFMRARVADFGLARVKMVGCWTSSVRGTFGYLDPEYISSRSLTRKSDVYSFGVLLFELITGRNPQQGLMEYVNFATSNATGRFGWEEISDPRLDGAFDITELNDVAAVAYKCINQLSRNRPPIRDVVQTLYHISQASFRKHHCSRSSPFTAEVESLDIGPSKYHRSISEHHRVASIGTVLDLPDV
ncbi:unnamed protein product [Musa hybrid cultivar]